VDILNTHATLILKKNDELVIALPPPALPLLLYLVKGKILMWKKAEDVHSLHNAHTYTKLWAKLMTFLKHAALISRKKVEREDCSFSIVIASGTIAISQGKMILENADLVIGEIQNGCL
jgi:hypothetical protein